VAPSVVAAEAAEGRTRGKWALRWPSPPIGARFWSLALGGAVAGALLSLVTVAAAWGVRAALGGLPAVSGAAVGLAWRERHQRKTAERLRDLQRDEILHANQELEKKFRDLETKIDQLSLL